MKKHLGVVVGVTMLGVAGFVVSQAGYFPSSLRGQLTPEGMMNVPPMNMQDDVQAVGEANLEGTTQPEGNENPEQAKGDDTTEGPVYEDCHAAFLAQKATCTKQSTKLKSLCSESSARCVAGCYFDSCKTACAVTETKCFTSTTLIEMDCATDALRGSNQCSDRNAILRNAHLKYLKNKISAIQEEAASESSSNSSAKADDTSYIQ